MMYILKGTCFVTVGSHTMQAMTGQLIFWIAMRHMPTVQIPVSKLSGYILTVRWRVSLRNNCVRKGSLLYPAHPDAIHRSLYHIYDTFRSRAPIAEDQISGTITNILSDLLSSEKRNKFPAKRRLVYLKPFHTSTNILQVHYAPGARRHCRIESILFSRVFARETGMTPHKYLISTRMANAKFC